MLGFLALLDLPPVYSARELLAKEFPQDPWLIEPLLSRGGDWLLAGDADSFKSLFLVQLCIHASLGLDYLHLKIEKPLKILYINLDDNLRMVQKRLNQLNITGLPLDDNFKVVCQPPIKLDPAGCEAMKQWVNDHTPDIFILDHLAGFVPGGTTDHHGMQDYVLFQKWVCNQGIGFAAVAHITRDTKDNADQSYTRRIAGVGLVISGHGVITFHDCLENTVAMKGERFFMAMIRNKNFDKEEMMLYNTTVEVQKLGNGTTLLKEV